MVDVFRAFHAFRAFRAFRGTWTVQTASALTITAPDDFSFHRLSESIVSLLSSLLVPLISYLWCRPLRDLQYQMFLSCYSIPFKMPVISVPVMLNYQPHFCMLSINPADATVAGLISDVAVWMGLLQPSAIKLCWIVDKVGPLICSM